ncbi:TPA: dTDP-4-dehydrorhamnose 3,5-epimerase family protein, partial [Photobacterium damselae subsp. damselae]
PEGFAHGFYVTSDEAEFVYKCTDYYAPEYETSIQWDDPNIDIQWPVDKNVILSKKDKLGIKFSDATILSGV